MIGKSGVNELIVSMECRPNEGVHKSGQMEHSIGVKAVMNESKWNQERMVMERTHDENGAEYGRMRIGCTVRLEKSL